MQEFDVLVESGQGLERRIRVTVPAGRIDQEVETRLRSVARTARIAGYRPGKAPNAVIRQRFGDQVRREVLQHLLEASYSEAVAREKLRPAGGPRISTDAAVGSPGQDLIYTASIEVFPEFQVQGLERLTVRRPEPKLVDSDLDFVIDGLRRQRLAWAPVSRPAATGDRVVVDFTGRIDGQPMEGGEGEGVPIVLGAGRMIADFERQLVGLRAADERVIQVRFPADYPREGMAGREAEFTVKVREVTEEALPEVDAEFIRALGTQSGDPSDFHDDIRRNMAREFEARSRADVRRQVLESLLQANPIDIPAVLVEQEAASLQADAMRNLGISDIRMAPGIETFREAATRRVRLGLLIGAVIRENQIVVERERVRAKLDELAEGYEKPDEVRKIYSQNAQLLGQVENAVLEEQVVEWLTSRAEVTPEAMSFQELVTR